VNDPVSSLRSEPADGRFQSEWPAGFLRNAWPLSSECACRTKRKLGRRGTCANSPYVKVSQIDAAVASGIADLLSILCDQRELLKKINVELATAWEWITESAARARRDPGDAQRPYTDGHGLAECAVVGATTELGGRPHSDIAFDPAADLPERAPQISLTRAACYARVARKALLGRDRWARKLLFRRVTQAVQFDPEQLEIQFIARLPGELTLPRGLGEWCTAKSPTLRSVAIRTYQAYPSKRYLTARAGLHCAERVEETSTY
jgi:hypothetical protein